MKGSLIITTFILSLLAIMPKGIAFNPETKECGLYQGGDENVSYILPQPWVINYGEPIQNESGNHQWDGDSRSIESFCNELGFTYIPRNLAEVYGKRTSSPLLAIRTVCKVIPFVLLGVGVFVGIALFAKWKKNRNKTRTKS